MSLMQLPCNKDYKERITGYYGWRESNPNSPHHGLDFAYRARTEVTAAYGGTVVFASYHGGGFGHCIVLYHGLLGGKHVYTLYAHLGTSQGDTPYEVYATNPPNLTTVTKGQYTWVYGTFVQKVFDEGEFKLQVHHLIYSGTGEFKLQGGANRVE